MSCGSPNELQESASPSRVSASASCYTNLQIQEALTTIRYGIEARKGLVIITGEAGVGKTTLLHKVSKGLADNVLCIVASDPQVSFADVLGLILRNIEPETPGDDELAMVRTCKLRLRSRLEQCRIVSLLMDDAHRLPDQTLRRLTQNFLGGSAEDPDGTLLQLVLAGPPELRTKIAQVALSPFNRKNPIMCELQPLNSRETGSYIEHMLRTRNRRLELFDERAIKRVALYTRGNPRTVNFVCDRALHLAGPDGLVTAELIDSVAAELNLKESQFASARIDRKVAQPNYVRKSDEADHGLGFNFPPGASADAVQPGQPRRDGRGEFHFPRGASADAEGPTFPPIAEEAYHRRSWLPRRERVAAWARGLSVLLIIVGAGAIIQSDAGQHVLAELSAVLRRTPTLPQEPLPEANKQPEVSLGTAGNANETTEKPELLVPLPGPDRPAVTSENENTVANIPALEPSDNGANQAAGQFSESRAAPNRIDPPRANRQRPAPLIKSSLQHNQQLKSLVTKAIENRAIIGVEVSVVQGTAYLDGHVATERQRRAAERAARSVDGVERVRNRIAITFG